MAEIAEAFYLPVGEGRYEATRATESPWDRTAQHGGPPSALLATLAVAGNPPGLRAGRVSVDFLGPIPRGEVTVEVAPLRPGRLVALTEARMLAGGRPVAVARVWSLATGPQPPVTTPVTVPAALPGSDADASIFPGLDDWGYGRALDWRYTAGSPETRGPADVWTRVRVPLLPGQELTGLQRALIAGDAANGLSAELPIDEWLSIPPGMAATLLREPEGEWVHLACRTDLSGDGLGLSRATVSDERGAVGEVTQPLLVRRR
ncbi:thioesterase family protein [Blastococcus sp. SYSU D00820]